MAAAASAASAAATEHSDATPLSELLNQESGQTGEYELKVIRVEIIDYTYPWQGKKILTQKLPALLKLKTMQSAFTALPQHKVPI